MKLRVNGETVDVEGPSLEAILEQLGHGGARVATAVNEEFVPAGARGGHMLEPGDRIEIVTPRQGG